MDAALTKAKPRVRVDQKGATGERVATQGANTKKAFNITAEDAETVDVASTSEDAEVAEVAPGDEAD